MNKYLRVYLPALVLMFMVHFSASAQNCTVNANGDHTICPSDPMVLSGSYQGSTNILPVWTQLSGPAVTITATPPSGGSAIATVTGFAPGGVYKFRLSSTCVDGTPISDDATYTVTKVTTAKANALDSIVLCPGTFVMSANAAGSGEMGTWSVISGGIVPPSGNTGSITLGTNDNTVGTSILVWTISTTTGHACQTSSTFKVINLGGAPNAVMPDINLSCYTLTTSTQLAAPFGGKSTEPRQRGTWSLVSGPTTPIFADIHVNNTTVSGLTQGTYKLRWTVAGQCQNYTSDVNVIVGTPSQSVTTVGDSNPVYCDGRSATVLTGPTPLYSGETAQWAYVSGPGTPVIASPTSPSTLITGLSSTGEYKFTYTITNAFGCSSTGTYTIDYTTPPSITLSLSSPQVLACNTTFLNIPYTTGGGDLTQWELVSAPAGAIIDTAAGTGGFNHFNNATGGTQSIVGLSKIGKYIIRFRRFSNNASGGCTDAFADMVINVSQAPYTATAGTAQLLNCNVTSTALAGNLPLSTESGTGSWSQISGPNTAAITDKTLNTTPISGLVPGTYTFRWTVTGGDLQCGDTQSDVNVVVSTPPTIVSAGSAIATCAGTTVTLAANTPQPGETGTWSFVSALPSAAAPTFANIHNPTTTATGFVASTAYTLRWTISNQCSSIHADVVVTTNATTGPKQATAGPDQCKTTATSFTLAGNAPSGGEVGTWTLLTSVTPAPPNTPTFTASQFNTTVSGVAVGTYTFEWKLDNNSCTTTRDTVVITISPSVTTAVITGGHTQNVCGITSPTLVANAVAANETGTWTQTAGPGGVVIVSPHSATTALTGITAARYTFAWTITNNACTSTTDAATYTYNATPSTAVAGTPLTICATTSGGVPQPASAVLGATAPTSGTGLWSVVSGPGNVTFSDPTSPTATASGLVMGIYTLQWMVSTGPYCPVSTATTTITVHQPAYAGTNQNLCNETTVFLQGNEGSVGTWTQVGTTPNTLGAPSFTTNSTAVFTGLITGTYTFKYTVDISGGACVDGSNSTVTVTVNAPPTTADAGPDQSICDNGAATITVSLNANSTTPLNGSSTGAWSILSKPSGSSASLSSTTLTTAQLLNAGAGTYLLQWTVTSPGCSGSTSSNDIVRINVYDPPTTALAMAAQPSACTGHIDLTGTTPLIGLGTWTQVSGPTTATFDQPNSPTTHVSGIVAANATPYVFRWTITNGPCTPSFQNVSVTVTDVTPTTASVTTPVSSVCTTAGTASIAALTGNTPTIGTGTWTVASQTAAGTATFGNSHSGTSSISGLTAGTYVLNWTIANLATACTTVAVDTIKVYDPPSTANAGTDASICYLSPVVLGAVAPTVGSGSWSVITNPHPTDPDPVFTSLTATNPTVTGLGIGTYTFRWTVSNGPCTISTADVNINVTDCQIAMSKEAGTPIPQVAANTYNVTFKFHIKNTSGTGITVANVQASDDLTTTFPSPKTFSIVSISNPGGLTVNSGFNGNSDKNLLVGTSSLASGVEEIVTVVVQVKLK